MADRNKAEQETTGRPAPAGAPVLAVEDLSIRFDGLPEGLSLVDGLSFSVEAGRTLCLVGESGCGKSLVSLAIMGLLASPPARITSGSVTLEGEAILQANLKIAIRSQIRESIDVFTDRRPELYQLDTEK